MYHISLSSRDFGFTRLVWYEFSDTETTSAFGAPNLSTSPPPVPDRCSDANPLAPERARDQRTLRHLKVNQENVLALSYQTNDSI